MEVGASKRLSRHRRSRPKRRLIWPIGGSWVLMGAIPTTEIPGPFLRADAPLRLDASVTQRHTLSSTFRGNLDRVCVRVRARGARVLGRADHLLELCDLILVEPGKDVGVRPCGSLLLGPAGGLQNKGTPPGKRSREEGERQREMLRRQFICIDDDRQLLIHEEAHAVVMPRCVDSSRATGHPGHPSEASRWSDRFGHRHRARGWWGRMRSVARL